MSITGSPAQRYEAAQLAMQRAVNWELNRLDNLSGMGRNLRVGVNSAMCDHAALAKLLVDKGIITDDEYMNAIAKEMEAEVKRYEDRVGKEFT